MNVRIPVNMTSKQRKAMKQEIRSQIAENGTEYEADYEAMMLWVLHKHYGFGKKRLLEFREKFIEEAKLLKAHYELDDVTYPAKVRLKELGVDIEALLKEEADNGN